MFPRHLPKKQLLLFLGDAFLITLAHSLSPSIRHLAFIPPQPSLDGAFLFAVYLFVFYTGDLYDVGITFRAPKYLFRFLGAHSVAPAIVAMGFYLVPALKAGRGIFVISAGLILTLCYLWRLVFERVFRGLLHGQKRLLIVGAGRSGRAILAVVGNNPAFNVVGFIDDDPGKLGASDSPVVLGDNSVLNEMIRSHGVDAVVIAITHLKSPKLLKSIMACKMEGVDVYDMPSFYEELTGRVPIEHVDDLWFINTPVLGVRRTLYNQKGKRALDLICSAFGLIASIPIILITAIAIKFESSGPVLYRQLRVGRNGENFELIKFRSMNLNAEKDGAVWADKDDPRVTRVGNIIRKLRIDEIPQMWNVLKGEMSFIGPRPERTEFVEDLKEKISYYTLRHSVKPGITGWAQVVYPYGASEKDALEKLKYDFFYIKNLSPLLDFHILLRTVRVVLFGKGAR